MAEERMPVKLCEECDTIKPLDNFYRTGRGQTKRCKPCHNGRRRLYAREAYTPKTTGYMKLPSETRAGIERDFEVRLSVKRIAGKYNINYSTLVGWRAKGQIPPYSGEPLI